MTPISAASMNKIEQELTDSQTIARGYAVKSVTLPPVDASTFTVVTVTIPISTAIEEMNIMLPNGALIIVFKDLNYCLTATNGGSKIKPNNKGLGVTSVLSQTSLELTPGDQVSDYVLCADVYIQGADLYLKFFANLTSEITVAIPVEYIARG